jgi:hypothetical protein
LPEGARFVGVDLSPLIHDSKASWPHLQLISEGWATSDTSDKTARIVRSGAHVALHTPRWLYVEYYTDDSRKTVRTRKDGAPEVELYDLAKDPLLLDNLARVPEATRRERGYAQSEIEKVMATMKPTLKKLATE